MTNSQATGRLLAGFIVGGILALAPSVVSANKEPFAPEPTTVAIDPLFPISIGADNPAVAAIQTTLDVTIDCDFGPQTEQAVKDWQTEHDLAVTGEVGLYEWNALSIPYEWGTDTNGNGTIDPSEVTLTCGDETVPEVVPTAAANGSGECHVTDHFSTSGSWSRIECPDGPDIYSRCDANFNCTSTVSYDNGDECRIRQQAGDRDYTASGACGD